MNAINLTAPKGMTGLAVAPWSKHEVYAVAANWAQASSPVMVYRSKFGDWDIDSHGRQVADFRHDVTAALRSLLAEVIEMGGDEPDDDEVSDIISDAEDLIDADVADVAEMLKGHGEQYCGNNPHDEAQGWLDAGFTVDVADAWCDVGCWDAETAAELRDAGITPDQAGAACEALVEGKDEDELREAYTDGSPMYSACSGDTPVDEIIRAAR